MDNKKRVPEKKQITLRTTVSKSFKDEFLKYATSLGYTESEMLRHIAFNFINEQKKIELAEQLKKIEREEKYE